MSDIKDYIRDAHKIATEKGFYDTKRDFTHYCMMIITEISEAVQSDRKNHSYEDIMGELADTTIRLFDFIAWLEEEADKSMILTKDNTFEEILKKTMEYFKTRPYKHGRKY